MYGVTKVAGELLCDYYYHRFGVDTRGVRFPGLISLRRSCRAAAPPTMPWRSSTRPSGTGHYTCFLGPDTRLDMMYMPDAIKACIDVMEADPARLDHRNAFNVTAMNFTPEELAAAIRKHIPDFVLDYKVDPVRQASPTPGPTRWTTGAARREWGWHRPTTSPPWSRTCSKTSARK